MIPSNPIACGKMMRQRNPMAVSIIVLAAFLCTGIKNALPQSSADSSKVKEETFTTTISRQVTFRYLIYLPQDHHPEKPWPMVLYLHGATGRGEDFDLLSLYPLPRLLRESGRSFPFITVMPQ
jgi:predicted peptidase